MPGASQALLAPSRPVPSQRRVPSRPHLDPGPCLSFCVAGLPGPLPGAGVSPPPHRPARGRLFSHRCVCCRGYACLSSPRESHCPLPHEGSVGGWSHWPRVLPAAGTRRGSDWNGVSLALCRDMAALRDWAVSSPSLPSAALSCFPPGLRTSGGGWVGAPAGFGPAPSSWQVRTESKYLVGGECGPCGGAAMCAPPCMRVCPPIHVSPPCVRAPPVCACVRPPVHACAGPPMHACALIAPAPGPRLGTH